MVLLDFVNLSYWAQLALDTDSSATVIRLPSPLNVGLSDLRVLESV